MTLSNFNAPNFEKVEGHIGFGIDYVTLHLLRSITAKTLIFP